MQRTAAFPSANNFMQVSKLNVKNVCENKHATFGDVKNMLFPDVTTRVSAFLALKFKILHLDLRFLNRP